MLTFLAWTAVVPAVATVFFGVFWVGFDFWRRHRAAAYGMIFGTLATFAVVVGVWHEAVFAERLDMPAVVQIVGWVLAVVAFVFGCVADRQIGLRVRSFTPFFDVDGTIELQTTGAYGVVRHPIYAAGVWWQLGVFLATGYLAVAAALLVFGGGAIWFTRQEERRLVMLLADPSSYERYRARVPALLPWPRRGADR